MKKLIIKPLIISALLMGGGSLFPALANDNIIDETVENITGDENVDESDVDENAPGTIPGDDFDSGMNMPDPDDPEDPEDPEEPENPWPATMVSGTLPVIYINTEDGAPIVSKSEYINATYWLDPMGTDFEAIGSEDDQKKTEIRGRGNTTWVNPEKKPYKLKLEKKTSLLGMPKNKHWALLADAKSRTVFTTALATELSNKMGLPWAPRVQPVEVVLNDEYIGIYSLVETIRVDENRVNIHEQADLEENPEEVAGAWLVEIDNNVDEYQYRFEDGAGMLMLITPDTPEELSDMQFEYLKEQMDLLDNLIYAEDKTDSSALEEILDFKSFARYYLIQELIDDQEAFSGSCYFYKDMGAGEKWTFGPVWDMGNAFAREKGFSRQFEGNKFSNHWVAELIKFPAMREAIIDVWEEFKAEYPVSYFQAANKAYSNPLRTLCEDNGPNLTRWPEYNINIGWNSNYVNTLLEYNYNLVDAWYRKLPEFYVLVPEDSKAAQYTLLSEDEDVEDESGEDAGEQDPEPDPEEPEGADGWVRVACFEGLTDCTYTASVEYLSTQFMIASADGESFVLGPVDEDNCFVVNNEALEIAESPGVFNNEYEYDNATITYDPAKKTILVSGTKSTGVSDVAIDGERVNIEIRDNVLTAYETVNVYMPAGQLAAVLSSGESVELVPGLYIIKSQGGKARKVLIN